MHGDNALSVSQVRRVNKAVRDDDATIFTDRRQSGESDAVRKRPVSGDQADIVKEEIIDNPHVSVRVLAARTGLSRQVITSI